MKLGLSCIALKASEQVAAAVLAEELGYDSVWAGEHILLTHRTVVSINPRPYGPEELMDPFVLLSHLAARTSRIRLATGVALLALRPPIMTARAVLGVDVLSKGRFDLGVGVGGFPDEYAAAGANMRTRGARVDEQLELLDRLFQPGDVEFEGRFYSLAATAFEPKPAQRPRPPILIGGWSDAALRRAARWDGWYGVVGDVATFKVMKGKMEAFRDEIGRGAAPFQHVLVFHEGMACKGAPSRGELEDFIAAGVDRVVVTPWGYDYAQGLPRIAAYAQEMGLC